MRIDRRCLWWPAAAAGVGLLLVLPGAGRWLIVRDDFAHADVAVVLSGQPIPRALGARDLYRQGQVDLLMVIPEPAHPALEAELDALHLLDPDHRGWAERILEASGVPRNRIVVLPDPADGSTVQEALAVRTALRGRDHASVVIVTSPSASRRARFIFRRLVGRNGRRVWSRPTPYERFTGERWWGHPKTALAVVTEYQKFVVNVVQLMLGWY